MILLWLFIAMLIVQCGYALYFFIRVFSLFKAGKSPSIAGLPVTIIICAKNEAANLRRNLPAVLSQKYSGKYEVIVVNDASTDSTAQVLQELEQQYDNLWDVVISDKEERTLKGKKFALSKGVAHATYDWLVLVDADCVPASDRWLEQMVAPLADGKEIVAGYGGYNIGGSILNAFVRWETVHTFLQYSTYSLAGMPYMAVGRNMACTKKVLLQAQQSEVWNALPSGDDDLLVSIVGTAQNTAIAGNSNAFTYSDAKATWKDWIKQKQRHLSTGKYYKGNIKLLLGLYGISHAAMWLLFFALLFTANTQMAIWLIGVRCFIYWLLWVVAAIRLNEKEIIYLFPFFDIGWVVYNFAFLPYIAWKNKNTWI